MEKLSIWFREHHLLQHPTIIIIIHQLEILDSQDRGLGPFIIMWIVTLYLPRMEALTLLVSNLNYLLEDIFNLPFLFILEIGAAPANAGSSSLLRLNTARRMLQDASQSLGRISTVPGPETQLFAMDNTVEGNYSGAMPFAQAATAAALAAAFSTVQSMGYNYSFIVKLCSILILIHFFLSTQWEQYCFCARWKWSFCPGLIWL